MKTKKIFNEPAQREMKEFVRKDLFSAYFVLTTHKYAT